MLKKPVSLFCVAIAGLFLPFEQGCSEEISLFWEKEGSSDSYLKLKDRVISSLLQENTRLRIEKKLIDLKIPYTLKVDQEFLPSHFSIFFDDHLAEEVALLNLSSNEKFAHFLEDTSFLNEFDQVKNKWSQWALNHKESKSSSFYDSALIDEIESILENTSAQDLVDYLKQEVKKTSPELADFLALPLTDEYREKITLFIRDFGDKSMSQLILERASMEARKEELAAVHPLRHIGLVWSDPDLHESMKAIKKANFKWTRYLKGMTRALKRHKLAGTLDEYVPGFSDFLHVDRDTVQMYLDKENYRGLFEYLLKFDTNIKSI
jgi:hypothetical protein